MRREGFLICDGTFRGIRTVTAWWFISRRLEGIIKVHEYVSMPDTR